MAASRGTVIGVVVAILGLILFFALVPGPKIQTFATTTTFDSLTAASLSSAVLLETSADVPERASLDNDLDNDGKVDGMADGPLALSVVVLCCDLGLGALLTPLVTSSTLLALPHKVLKLVCAYYPPLEHPG
jgi:hypothetical protein